VREYRPGALAAQRGWDVAPAQGDRLDQGARRGGRRLSRQQGCQVERHALADQAGQHGQ
jgi:hypothetical protein